MRFEASQVVFSSLSCYKELKLTTKPLTGRALHSLPIQMLNISLRSSGIHRKQNLVIKSDTAVLTFTFLFFSSPLFLLFLSHLFFLLLGIQQASFWWETFLRKLQDLRIRWKERQVGSGTRFSWKFSGQCYMAFCCFLRYP